MTEKKINWTRQQQRAITERNRDVLVTASAGTGKTAVLSARAVDIIADKNLCPDVWSILVVTFTDAAAEQMRRRIAEQLAELYRLTADEHLRRQLALLQGADISTIHSFCKRLITDHFYRLDLDPTFGIIDADEQRLLKAEVLEQTIDWAWRQDNLAPQLDTLLEGRDVRPGDGFLSAVIEISDFLEGVVCPARWFEKAGEICNSADTSCGIVERQKEIIRTKLDEILARLEQTRTIYEKYAQDKSWSEKFISDYFEPVENLVAVFNEQNWQTFTEQISAYKKPRVIVPKDVDKNITELIRSSVKEALGIIDNIKALTILNPDYLDKVSPAADRQTRVLVELVRKFEQIYTDVKRSLNRLDFADLERYALRLLSEAETLSQESPTPSQVALNLRKKYRYIFVDEYQDINPVQKAIIDLLAGPVNTFVVGDVKQSIYAFRGAEPRIFIEGLKSASVEPKQETQSRRVDLNWNFRSAKGLLDFVNTVFVRLMTQQFAGIDYDTAAMLQCAFEEESKQQIAPAKGPRVEIHLLNDHIEQENDTDTDGDEQSISGEVTARQRQAAMIARRIQRMVGADSSSPQFEIYDKQLGKTRPVEYRDIVILMRSPAKRANVYVEVLQLAGVPVACKEASGYFEATEISDCLCLLKVLDNPQRDIELAAVLRGPVFGFDDSELAKIRLCETDDHCGYYDCALSYAEQGKDRTLKEKIKKALADIEKWRRAARAQSIADLLWQIYRQSGLLAFYSALPNGRIRRANLLKLHDRAIQFEGFAAGQTSASLGRFVTFIEQLQDSGADWAGAEPEDSAANAVRIMSVHKSKGLEFPVVFLAELNAPFNFRDIQSDILLGLDVPLGLTVVDRAANAKLSSAAYQVLKQQKLESNLAEEMRIMYVAMTRAKERLILTASAKRKKCEALLRTGFEFKDAPVPSWQLAKSKSLLDWLLFALSSRKSLHDAFQTQLKPETDDDFDVKLYENNELLELSQYIDELKKAKKPRKKKTTKDKKSGLLEPVKQSLSWKYDYQPATLLPAKQSVTQLTHHSDEFVQMDYSRSLERRPRVVLTDELKKAQTLDARVAGTAAHLVISSIDLTKDVNTEAIRQVIDGLIANGQITREAAHAVDVESVAEFFHNELGRIALDPANRVRREWPFTFALPISDDAISAVSEQSQETIVVQGIMDMLIETSKGLVVIDFKTDKVSGSELQKRAELYKTQLRLYARAAQLILKKHLSSAWLYFLAAREAVQVQ